MQYKMEKNNIPKSTLKNTNATPTNLTFTRLHEMYEINGCLETTTPPGRKYTHCLHIHSSFLHIDYFFSTPNTHPSINTTDIKEISI